MSITLTFIKNNMFEKILTRIVVFIFAWLILWGAFGTKAKATEIITSDVGSWSANYGFQTCYGYGGAKPCVSNGTYFPGDGIGTGDVIFAYSASYYIYNTFTMPAGFSGSTMYLSLDLMTGPRNSEQGNKSEYVVITVIQKDSSGNTLATSTINQTITNTTMSTYDYTVPKNASTNSVYVQISGRDGGYWAGNYGAVIGANTITLNDGASATPVYSSEPTSTQLNLRTTTRNITGSGVYINQVGDNLDLDVVQQGDDNLIAGTNTTNQTTSDANISGDYNTVNLSQKSDNNVLLFGINGDHNDLIVSQGDNVNDTGDHRAIIDITGNYNYTSLTQYDTGFGSGQFSDININGNDNTITSHQRETDKMLFIDIDGNDNTVTTNQKDSGNHFLDITLGSNQTVTATQEGSGDHNATINMNGYTSGLSLTQSGSTDKVYSLDQTCVNSGGCGTTTINQQ